MLARHLAAEAIGWGELLAWFEELYVAADTEGGVVPWADGVPNPQLVVWSQDHNLVGYGRKALVIGCGLGDDAEFLAALGFAVVAFDVAPTAVAWCRRRFPQTGVEYVVADLLEPPEAWTGAFDFVFEANTLQVLPSGPFRDQAIECLASFVSAGGMLLVVARGREEHEPVHQVPWPLTHAEVTACGGRRLSLEAFEDFYDNEAPPVRRFVAEFSRTSSS